MKNDIPRDFNHLSQDLTFSRGPIPYEIVVILEKCLEDVAYKRLAKENLKNLAATHEKAMIALKNLVADTTGQFSHIQLLATEILNEAVYRTGKTKAA